uniref:Putative hainantoxin-xiv-4 n=1 Tax=Amblyomma americanum TaxID=6943 RepID=A0A0C9SES3_AMBAM
MKLTVFFLARTALLAICSTRMCILAKGDDDHIEWGPQSSGECSSSAGCGYGSCCLRDSNRRQCGPLAGIGQYCSEKKNTDGEVYEGYCPCEEPFTCGDKSEGIRICEAP